MSVENEVCLRELLGKIDGRSLDEVDREAAVALEQTPKKYDLFDTCYECRCGDKILARAIGRRIFLLDDDFPATQPRCA